MKTRELSRLLKPLHPCLDGLKRLLKHDTVRQWWASCGSVNDLFYVWSFVATADSDAVFAIEIMSEICERFPERNYATNDIAEHRRSKYAVIHDSCLAGLGFNKKAADWFRSVFRCPTDAELRMAGRYFAEKEKASP